MSELKACPICKGTRICMDGGDNTYHPRCLDCGCTAPFDAWQSRTPAPAEVEDLLDHIISAANSVSIPSESNYLNELKSRLLAALSNKCHQMTGGPA